jgi:hypothetical protein
MWIQLEITYRQLWLEAEGRRPPLIVKLEFMKEDNIALLVRNTSALPIVMEIVGSLSRNL